MNYLYLAVTAIFFTLNTFSTFARTVPNDSLQAVKYYQKADTLLLFNLHDSSIHYFKKAEKIFAEIQNYEGVISCKNKIAENLSADFLLDEALTIAEEALRLCHQHLKPDHLEEANAYLNIGNVHYLTGQHEQALEEYNKAKKIIDDISHDEKHLYAAPTNMGIGNVYYGKLQYKEAFNYFKNALNTNTEILGRNHPYVANSLLSLGNLYRNKGSYNLAKDHYNEALEIYINTFGDSHPDVATTYVGLGDIYKSSGELEKALQYYNQALIIYSDFLNSKNPKFGAVYIGFADIAKNRGNFDEAIKYYNQALELYKNTVGELHQNTIQCLLGFANTFIYQEKFYEALDYYGKVLEINFNLVGEDHENTSAAYNNLGSLYYFAGDFDLAETYFEKALKIDQNIHGPKHPNVANANYNLARVNDVKGNTVKALEYVQSAINASIMDFQEANIFVNPALVNFFDNRDLLWYLQFKGELLESGFSKSVNMKGLDISLNSFILSDSLVDQIRESYTDRKDQIELARQASKIYESAISGSYNMLQLLTPENAKSIAYDATYESKKEQYTNYYFYLSEKKKGAILFSSLAQANATSFGDVPDSLVVREQVLKKQINEYTQELAANPDSLQQVYYQKKLFDTNKEYEDLIHRLENEFPKYHDLKYDVGVVNVDEIQSFLDDSTMIISYFSTEDHLFTNYITSKSFDINKSDLMTDYTKAIQAYRNTILFRYKKGFTKYSRELYKQFFSQEIPDGIKSLIIVLDGVMATVPFETLLTEDVSDTTSYQDMPYLVKDYAVSYTFSANLLYKTFLNEKTLREKAQKELFTVAPIVFEGSYGSVVKEKKTKSYEEAGVAPAVRKKVEGLKSSTLPGSKVESEQIDSVFRANNKESILLQYDKASEDMFKRSNISDYQYVHIASHGFVNQEEPEFSGILFHADTTQEDGILFAGEVYDLNMNAELVTLSACETGLGKISSGEGIVGLSRALIYAGCKNINVSLWEVSDLSTQVMMSNLYMLLAKTNVPNDKFKSLDYRHYLRNAKLSLINSEEYSHPYYWSPFVLIGK